MTGPAPSRALNVLAVDDDLLVLMNTTLLLEELGHRVVEASSGPAALACLAADGAIDLVITDQGMPEMTGLQLAAAVRAVRPDLPVIIATGYTELPGGESCVRIGKPFDARALAAAIERALKDTPGSTERRPALARESGVRVSGSALT